MIELRCVVDRRAEAFASVRDRSWSRALRRCGSPSRGISTTRQTFNPADRTDVP
jgi:hypothetical protein